MNTGYVKLLQAVRKDTGIPVFLAPVGLAWQAVRGVISREAAANSTQASGAAHQNTTGPVAISTGGYQPAKAPSTADDSLAAAPAASAKPSAVASFMTVPKGKSIMAAQQPPQAAAAPDQNLMAAICGHGAEAPTLAPDLAPAGPPAGSPPAAARQLPAAAFGLPWTSAVTAGRKLLHRRVASQLRPSADQHRSVGADLALDEAAGIRHRLQEVGAVAQSAASAPAPQLPASGVKDVSAALPPATLITNVNGSASGTFAPAPSSSSDTALDAGVRVPAVSGGEPVKSEIYLPAQSASAPSTNMPGKETTAHCRRPSRLLCEKLGLWVWSEKDVTLSYCLVPESCWHAGKIVDVCRADQYPASQDTFRQMYENDGNHPSEQGTYLEGLVIVSAMTGAAFPCFCISASCLTLTTRVTVNAFVVFTQAALNWGCTLLRTWRER